ncbi:hypothetical protein X975_21028, partial [Stegodyphus mimosarum]
MIGGTLSFLISGMETQVFAGGSSFFKISELVSIISSVDKTSNEFLTETSGTEVGGSALTGVVLDSEIRAVGSLAVFCGCVHSFSSFLEGEALEVWVSDFLFLRIFCRRTSSIVNLSPFPNCFA